MVYTLSFSLKNAVCFIILTYLVPVLFTFYIQAVLKLKKKNNSGAKSLIKFNFFRQIFKKSSNIKFHEIVSNDRWFVPWGQTDMTRAAVTFRNFSKAPKKETESLEPNTTHNVEYIRTNHASVEYRIPMDLLPYTSSSSCYTFSSCVLH